MRRSPVLISLFVALVHASNAHSQPATPSTAQFTSTLQTVVTNEAKWRSVIQSVKVEELPVSDAIGKQFDQSKYIVNEDLKMVVLWANRANKERSLFAEVNLLSSIQEFQGHLNLFVATLNQYEMANNITQKRIGNWADAMSNLANGSVEDVFKTTRSYTTDQAHLVDQKCVGAGAMR
jgi:hypothetical protein